MRGRSPNYQEKDLKTMLDIVEKRRRIGTHDWAVVMKEFNGHAKKSVPVMGDLRSLDMQYECLVNMKNPTGSALSPEAVRRKKTHCAKHFVKSERRIRV